MFVCLFVCLFTDSGSCKSIALLRALTHGNGAFVRRVVGESVCGESVRRCEGRLRSPLWGHSGLSVMTKTMKKQPWSTGCNAICLAGSLLSLSSANSDLRCPRCASAAVFVPLQWAIACLLQGHAVSRRDD